LGDYGVELEDELLGGARLPEADLCCLVHEYLGPVEDDMRRHGREVLIEVVPRELVPARGRSTEMM